MCASGLFSFNEPPQTQAEQIVNFRLECIQILEKVHEDLNSSLSVRVGVNSGGPIIAVILGFDRPTFD
jgi:hypothetical protein